MFVIWRPNYIFHVLGLHPLFQIPSFLKSFSRSFLRPLEKWNHLLSHSSPSKPWNFLNDKRIENIFYNNMYSGPQFLRKLQNQTRKWGYFILDRSMLMKIT